MKKTLLIAAASLLVGACASTPTDNRQVVAGSGTLRLGGTATAPEATKAYRLSQESWVKDEDAKDKTGPDAIR